MPHKRIFLSPPHMSGGEQEYINQAFQQNWIAPLGPNVDAFEKKFAQYIGVNSAAAVSSGTAAVHLALKLLGVNSGDTVFCSTLTFVASANPIIYQGAEPVFIDSEPDTWNMSPKALERAFEEAIKIGKLPKAVILVHLFGQSAKLDEIITICNKYAVPIIEDSAESLGATYKRKQTGSFGKFGVFSFNGNKIITTSGGGMLVSNDEMAIKRARFLSTQARNSGVYYEHSEIGYNYRMSNIIAGIGLAQLKVLDARVQARRNIYKRYQKALGKLPGIKFIPDLQNTVSNRWLSTFLIDENVIGITPLELIETLAKENIEARPMWKPLHLQSVFANFRYYMHGNTESISDLLFTQGICIPSGSNLEVKDQEKIINLIKLVVKKSSV